MPALVLGLLALLLFGVLPLLLRILAHPFLSLYQLVILAGSLLRAFFGLGFAFTLTAFFLNTDVPRWLIVAFAVSGIIFHLIKTYAIDPAMITLLDHGGLINYLIVRRSSSSNV